jgi:F0F1-type ATP synthase membrane subunit b/b'
MTAEQAAEAGKSLNFEKVWAALMETRQQMTDLSAETAKHIKELSDNIKETDDRVRKTNAETSQRLEKASAETNQRLEKASAETAQYLEKVSAETSQHLEKVSAETGQRIKDLSDNIGGINNTLGKLTEAMVSCNVWCKFEPLGYAFTTASQNRVFFENGRRIAESDFFLENGDFVMPIEVKTTLEVEDVNKHLKRIGLIRHYLDSRHDGRKIVAAMAGAVVSPKVLDYAHENGLYVLVLNGENIDVADGGEGFKARSW